MRAFLIVLAVLLVSMWVISHQCEAGVIDKTKKVYDTDWLTQKALKYGFIGNFCVFQTLNGVVEGYHFRDGGGGTYIATKANYHTYATVQRISGITLGWMAYANYRSANISNWNKVRRAIGAACYGRNCFEWAYKWQKYNNPFDYTAAHNKCALVGIGVKDGKLVDVYFSTGPFTGPLVDFGFLAIGWILMK